MGDIGATSTNPAPVQNQILPQYSEKFEEACPPGIVEFVQNLFDLSDTSVLQALRNFPSNAFRIIKSPFNEIYYLIWGLTDKEKACEKIQEGQVSLNKVDAVGRTTFTAALERGDLDGAMVYALGSSLEQRDANLSAPLHAIAAIGTGESVGFFVDADVNLDAKDSGGRTPVHLAALSGNKEVLTALLDAGAKLDETDKKGRTPILFAAANSATCFELLLERGGSVTSKDDSGAGVWHYAATNQNSASIMSLLFSKEYDANQIDLYGRSPFEYAAECNNPNAIDNLVSYGAKLPSSGSQASPLHLAGFHGHDNVVHRLFAHGVDGAAKDEAGRTALHMAAGRGKLAAVGALLSNNVPVDGLDNTLETPLYQAAANNQTAVVARLLEAKADPSLVPLSGRSARYTAVKLGHSDVAELLKEVGASMIAGQKDLPLHVAVANGDFVDLQTKMLSGTNLNEVDADGQSALMLALITKQEGIIGSLFNTDLAAADNNGLTALHFAASYGKDNIVTELMQRGADPKAVDGQGRLPIHYAAAMGNGDAIKLLAPYALGSDDSGVDIADGQGFTPLHLSVIERQPEGVSGLLAVGANPIIVDNQGRNAVHHAAMQGDVAVVRELLQDVGEAINWKDRSGNTPLYYAAVNGHTDAMTLLMENGGFVYQEGQIELQQAVIRRDTAHITNLLTSTALVVTDGQGPTGLHDLMKIADSKTTSVVLSGMAGQSMLDARDASQKTLLHAAAELNDVQAMSAAINAGISLDARDNNGETALHVVAKKGNIEALEEFSLKAANLNAANSAGKTPLAVALANGKMEFVDKMLSFGASLFIDRNNERKSLAFLNMILNGNTKGVEHFEVRGVDISVKDDRGLGALHYAAMRANSADTIDHFVKSGLSVNEPDSEGRTPMHIAVALGDQANVRALLSQKADATLENKLGETPADIAKEKKLGTILKMLPKPNEKSN